MESDDPWDDGSSPLARRGIGGRPPPLVAPEDLPSFDLREVAEQFGVSCQSLVEGMASSQPRHTPLAPLAEGRTRVDVDTYHPDGSSGSTEEDENAVVVADTTDGNPKVTVPYAATGYGTGRRGVHFKAIHNVVIFREDQSLYIAVEYARPLLGWCCLVLGIVCQAFHFVLQNYIINTGTSTYTAFLWTSQIEFLMISLILLLSCTYYDYDPDSIRYMQSLEGSFRVLLIGVMSALATLTTYLSSSVLGSIDFFLMDSFHALFVIVFKLLQSQGVFLGERVGVVIVVSGYAISFLTDNTNQLDRVIGNILGLAKSLYIATFLLLTTSVKSKVLTSVLLFYVVAIQLLVSIAVAAIGGTSSGMDPGHGAFGYLAQTNSVHWYTVLSAIVCTLSLVCFVRALAYLHPVTISCALSIPPLLMKLMNHTNMPMCTSDDTKGKDQIYAFVQDVMACFIVTVGTVYVTYISVIKRQYVEIKLNLIKRRRRPRNPYESKRSGSSATGSLLSGDS